VPHDIVQAYKWYSLAANERRQGSGLSSWYDRQPDDPCPDRRGTEAGGGVEAKDSVSSSLSHATLTTPANHYHFRVPCLAVSSVPSYNTPPCEVAMSWIDAVIFEFTRVTWGQWVITVIMGIGGAWLAVLVKWYLRTKK